MTLGRIQIITSQLLKKEKAIYSQWKKKNNILIDILAIRVTLISNKLKLIIVLLYIPLAVKNISSLLFAKSNLLYILGDFNTHQYAALTPSVEWIVDICKFSLGQFNKMLNSSNRLLDLYFFK